MTNQLVVLADEIERLRTRLQNAHEVAAQSDREIEQLQRAVAERDQFLEAAGRATQLADERAMEIERLTIERDIARRALALTQEQQRSSVEPPLRICNCRVDHKGCERQPGRLCVQDHYHRPTGKSSELTAHTIEDDFRHFLSYSKLSGQPAAEIHHLRLAYYGGADKPIMGAGQGPDETRSVAEPVRRPGSLSDKSSGYRTTTFTSPFQAGNLPCDHCGWGVAQHESTTLRCRVDQFPQRTSGE